MDLDFKKSVVFRWLFSMSEDHLMQIKDLVSLNYSYYKILVKQLRLV